MKVPIRMLGIITSVFWVLLIVFIILAAYSIKDLKFDIDEPEVIFDTNGELIFNLPIVIDNGGYYSLKEFNITTLLSNSEGLEISKANSYIPDIPSQEILTINHNTSLNLNDVFQDNENYLFEDDNLHVLLSVGVNFAEVLPSQISTNFTFPWGAPLSNFSLGTPNISIFNSTHSLVSVLMSYDNHAFYDLVGSIDIGLYNDQNALLDETQELIITPQQTSYTKDIELYVTNSISLDNIQNGYFSIFFSTFFEYGPLVIPFG